MQRARRAPAAKQAAALCAAVHCCNGPVQQYCSAAMEQCSITALMQWGSAVH